VGSLAGGIVYEHIGPSQLFLGSAVGIAVGIVIVWAAAGRRADAPMSR
jgi:predicted MFS family arabinose efflux permease